MVALLKHGAAPLWSTVGAQLMILRDLRNEQSNSVKQVLNLLELTNFRPQLRQRSSMLVNAFLE
jgi:hypothetical protein